MGRAREAAFTNKSVVFSAGLTILTRRRGELSEGGSMVDRPGRLHQPYDSGWSVFVLSAQSLQCQRCASLELLL